MQSEGKSIPFREECNLQEIENMPGEIFKPHSDEVNKEWLLHDEERG
jgi:hypothetical protein